MFELKNNAHSLRQGALDTGHGKLYTPFFMPVATKGSIRGIGNQEIYNQFETDIILMNTYHLYLKPGYELVHKLGGLHKFTNLTNSIGFSVIGVAVINNSLTESRPEIEYDFIIAL